MPTPNDPFDLTGRKALITGATRGIGLAVAVALARRGAAVAITGRKADALAEVVSGLQNQGIAARGLVCNQGDPAAVRSLFEQLDGSDFPVDVAVVNAATNPVMGPLLDIDLDAWRKILDVNLTGALLTAQAAGTRMRSRGRGSLIFMASIAGIDPMPGLGAYSVSKSGMLGLTRVLAKELGPAGVRVNAIAPGLVETRFSAALFRDRPSYEALMRATPLGRHGQPEDIAGAAVFLASDASAYMTGQVLLIDGGGRV
jgi:NAD(P)-dependent dehydrogenase (short-subunit alcohol dehydrogenase family)